MERKSSFWPAFLIVLFLCIVILTFFGKLNFLSSFLEKRVAQIEEITFHIFRNLPFVSQDEKVKQLEQNNLELLSRVSDFEKLKKENSALSDQFQTSYPSSAQLLEAQIIGAPSFIPGISTPNTFIINKGLKDNLEIGQAVIIKNNLVGKISQISANLSEVTLVNSPSFSFTAKTQNGTAGIVKGGTTLTFGNVLLSENIASGELVLTKGDIASDGLGIPPDLVVGKIVSVEKNPSDLFQRAKVQSPVNFAKLDFVFVYIQNR